MNERYRKIRDQRIETLYRQGLAPSTIAERFDLKPARIHTILKQHGIVFEQVRSLVPQESIWERGDDDKRRRAIWERARRGAHAALQETA